jgi:membrane protease YdiL (CAAX protease family)
MKINARKIALFLGLTFSVNWAFVGLFFFFGGRWGSPSSMLVAIVYMFIPAAVAVTVQKLLYRQPVIKPLGISFRLNRWFAVAWLLPFVLTFSTLGVSLFFPWVEYSPDMSGMFERFKTALSPQQLELAKRQVAALPMHPVWISLFAGLMAGPTINAIAGFGEELGWRGFLQSEFAPLGFWKSSFLIGALWGVWHAPLILAGHNYPEHPKAGVFMMIVFCTLYAPIFSHVRRKAKSVIAAAVLHGSLNAGAGIAIMVVKGGDDLTVGVTGLAGLIVLAIADLCLFLFGRTVQKKTVPEPS